MLSNSVMNINEILEMKALMKLKSTLNLRNLKLNNLMPM